MKQSQLIKIVDICSFIALMLIVSTGTLLEFTLPVRSGSSTVWNLTRHEWGDIHGYVSIMFLFMMSLHIVTHLKHIKQVLSGNVRPEHQYRIGIGVIALIIILFAPAISPVNEGEQDRKGYGA